jgi:hypothetical protein
MQKPQLAGSGAQCQRQDVMQRCPEPRVVDVEHVVARVLDDPRQHLSGFDRHLPVGKVFHSHAKSEDAAEQHYP